MTSEDSAAEKKEKISKRHNKLDMLNIINMC